MNKKTVPVTPIVLSGKLKEHLKKLAMEYEKPEFLPNDPSRFMHMYTDRKDQETVAFISSCLSFGRRDQILLKTSSLLDHAGPSPSEWIGTGSFRNECTCSSEKFYRIYSYSDIFQLYAGIQSLLREYGSLGTAFRTKYQNLLKNRTSSLDQTSSHQLLLSSIITSFPSTRLVPHTGKSACKRLNMFLRWMVRTKSPVDMGIWTWYDPADLIIPLDTHVLQESKKLGLLPQNSPGNYKTAVLLTEEMKQIWPDDPCKADFALFGLGIKNKQ